jgi:hypothetical protein
MRLEGTYGSPRTRGILVSKRISLTAGGTVAILGAVAKLVVLILGGIRIIDRAIYKYGLEPLSRAEQRCQGLVPRGLADSEARWNCLRAELRKLEEPVWKGTLPLFLAAILASVTIVGGLAVAIRSSKSLSKRE